ncbi:hypothetical protein KFE25_009962 [Diacronema lutheri]|uniref:TLC domain-containing protein n=1 Tax=Diacronema lutheri TaxID=2081491 RepID=A0A8J5XJL6_DIALT|nr:hypothetical protein KFE25_009962 [Diacronema lutheri]|mmetsp:Transcript_18527/g.57719  ORF Transcript_18527/g.57719 Transcript_18527/m.57719 type:complete len:196 (-) Transcript_18527:319-906(-)
MASGSKQAAAVHGRFNLFAITPLVVLTIVAYATSKQQSVCLSLSYATAAHIAIDTVWNLVVPQCQPTYFRWSTVMLHHLVTFWLVLHPCMHVENADMTPACTIVEINTLLLTASRHFKKSKAITYSFYVTWVTMRLMWYPYIAFDHHARITQWGATMYDYSWMQTVGTVIVLCVLNVLWTYEVIKSLLPKKPKDK